MKEMIKLANATMHDQSQYQEDFKLLGYDVEAEPRLRQVSGADDAYTLAWDTVAKARAEGFDGLLLGGRTDVMIYIALLSGGLKLYIAETERVRDEQDRFIFNLKGVTPIHVTSLPEECPPLLGAAQIDLSFMDK